MLSTAKLKNIKLYTKTCYFFCSVGFKGMILPLMIAIAPSVAAYKKS